MKLIYRNGDEDTFGFEVLSVELLNVTVCKIEA